MKTMRIAIAVVATLVAATAFSQAEYPQTRHEIEATFQKWDMLIARGDVDGMLAMVDKSFTMTDANGHVQYFPQAKQTLVSMMTTLRNPRCSTTIHQIQEQGNEVVAWVTVQSTYQQQSGSGWVAMKKTMRLAETLRRSGGGWKFVASQALPPAD